jgi:phosphoglycerol transferase MdoB-like AlkP superfamily enzyme
LPFLYYLCTMKKYLRAQLLYWRPFFLLAAVQMITFIFFRIILFSLNTSRLTDEFFAYQTSVYLFSFRFDLLITSYLFILVWLLFSLRLNVSKISVRPVYRFLIVYFVIVDLFVLLLVCSDIPYYTFFNERINPAIILWINNPEMMINFLKDSPQYLPFFLLYILAFTAMIYCQLRILKHWKNQPVPEGKGHLAGTLILAAMVFVGMRGGIQTRALEVRDSFRAANNYVNQFPLNPVLTYLNNFIYQNTSYLSDDDFSIFLKEQNIDLSDRFPLARKTSAPDSAKKWNVVLIIMESMTGNVMKEFGNQENLTPFLDSLTGVSMNVKGLYSTGTHTCNGVYSTLFSLPSFMGVHPMSNPGSVSQDFYGMPAVLKEKGYQNIFFTSHSRYWDNMQIFLTKNGMDTIYDDLSHRQEARINAFGMPDEAVFETALKKIDERTPKGPVFASILTISTHIPYTIPEFSKYSKLPQLKDPMKNVYRYADWSIKQFFEEARQKPWFENTLFVLVADHGINLEPESDMPLSFHRAPLIFFKKDLPPQQLNMLASQTDIFPTVMGLLNQPYTNNTMGIDLRKEKRPYTYFVGTNTIGCVDSTHFYIYRKFGSTSIIKIGDKTQKDLSEELADKKTAMEKYALGNLQLCAEILETRKAGKPD